MSTFGRRTASTPTASVTAPSSSSSPAGKVGLLGLLAGLSAVVALHVWFNVLKVPLARPIGALFDPGPASNQGWAAWYWPAVAAAALTFLILRLYFRQPHRWTVPGLAVAGLVAVLFGAWAAFWVKSIGYAWYFVPGASATMILAVQPQMAPIALGGALRLLLTKVPLLLAIGFVAGGLVGLLARLPLRGLQPETVDSAVASTADPPRAGAPHSAGWFARLGTTVFMTLLGGSVGAGIPAVGLLIMPVVALVWLFVSFRGGRYSFRNVAIGGAAIAFLSSLPLTIAMIQLRAGETLLLSMATRLPFFILVSVGTIKIVLFLSRKLRRAPVTSASSAAPAIPQTK